MGVFKISGGNRLKGEINVESSKNAILPILAASILNGSKSTITNYPNLRDVNFSEGILTAIGCKLNIDGSVITIDSSYINKTEIPEDLSREMRSSILFMGPTLARFGQAKVGYPGGCEIGPRPIDLHLRGLRRLGARIEENRGFIYCKVDKLKGCDIQLDYPSVGATENIMMTAVYANGTTYIKNAAREPEVIDLQNYLNQMGAKICGAGTNTIMIEGVSKLNAVEYAIIPDRIVAGTYMCAAAITGGDICLRNIRPEHLDKVIQTLRTAGCNINIEERLINIKGPSRPKSIEVIRTLSYPGFPTDLQAPILALMTIAKGTSVIIETVFESRYKHISELVQMGAIIMVDGRSAIVKGVKKLKGTSVRADDLRGGIALVLAGLAAEGETCISCTYHIDRGYENLEQKLSLLGADIKRYDEY